MNESGQKVVLVVEDDDDGRSILCRILKSLGYTPLDFPSGQAALDGIPGKKIDAALVDIMMPEMNGYEFVEKMKQLAEFEDLPVIMVTAKDKDEEILEGYSFGADYYITKPYTSKQIDYGLKLVLE